MYYLTRQQLRELVDIVWNAATESEEVPSTSWADYLIDKALKTNILNKEDFEWMEL